MSLVGLSKSLIICGFLNIIMVKCEDILDTFTLSSISLDTANYHQFGAYHANTDTIWLLGGYKCQTCTFSYDPSEDSITQHSDITGGYNNNQDNSVIIGNIIYFITRDGDLASYDVSSGSETNPLVSLGLTYPCLGKNEDNTQLYIINGNYDVDFYIYDIENEAYYSGPDLNFDRFVPGCTVDENNFLYVSFGYEDKIERINLTYFSSNSYTEYNDIDWEILTSDTQDPTLEEEMDCSGNAISTPSTIEVFGDIYIITGYCSTSSSDEGFIIKLDTDEFELSYIGRTPEEMSRGKLIITNSNSANDRRVYLFGGYSASAGSALDEIYYSNIVIKSSSSSSSVFSVSSEKSSVQSNVLMNMRLEKIVDNQNGIIDIINQNGNNAVLNNNGFILFTIGVLLLLIGGLIGGLIGIIIYKKMDSSMKEKPFSYQSIEN